MNRKAITIIALCFSVVVAIYNLILGRPEYIAFFIPFAVSILSRGFWSSISELVGFEIIALFLVWLEDMSIGILVFVIISVMFFSHGFNKKYMLGLMAINCVMVFSASAFNYSGTYSFFTHALLDTMLYACCEVAVYISLTTMRKRESALDEKYLEVIDELQSIAHEYIDTLRQKHKEANDDRR